MAFAKQTKEKRSKQRIHLGGAARKPLFLQVDIMWIQEGFTVEPLRNNLGAIRIRARKSELQAESRS